MNCGAACFPGGQAPFSTTKDTKVHKVNNSDGTVCIATRISTHLFDSTQAEA
jgi:hypothetical protein